MAACGPAPGSVKLPLRMRDESVEVMSLERTYDPPAGFLPVKPRSRASSRFPRVGASCALCYDPLHLSALRFSEQKRQAYGLRDCVFWCGADVSREAIVGKSRWDLHDTLLIEVVRKCGLLQVEKLPSTILLKHATLIIRLKHVLL